MNMISSWQSPTASVIARASFDPSTPLMVDLSASGQWQSKCRQLSRTLVTTRVTGQSRENRTLEVDETSSRVVTVVPFFTATDFRGAKVWSIFDGPDCRYPAR